MMTAAAVIAILPFSDVVDIFGTPTGLYGVDPSIGILFAFAFGGISFYGLMLGGWASGSKYSFLGSMRAAAQLISYEVAQGLSLVGVVMMVGSLSLTEIVRWQEEHFWMVGHGERVPRAATIAPSPEEVSRSAASSSDMRSAASAASSPSGEGGGTSGRSPGRGGGPVAARGARCAASPDSPSSRGPGRSARRSRGCSGRPGRPRGPTAADVRKVVGQVARQRLLSRAKRS